MTQIQVTRDLLVEDAVFILQCLRQNQRGGRRNDLAGVRTTLEGAVALDLGDYVAFLRRFGYLSLDAQKAALLVTDEGEKAAVGKAGQQVFRDVGEHFAPLIAAGRVELEDDEDLAALQRSSGLAHAAVAEAATLAEVPAARALVAVKAPRLAAVEGEIGQGNLARVRAVRVGALSLPAALKDVKPVHRVLPWLSAKDLEGRVRAQAAAQAQLAHPFVLPVLDVLEPDPSPEGGTELPRLLLQLAAGSLRERLRGASVAVPEALRLTAQVALALAHAHARSLAHGALKPENVLLDARGNVLLSDFGVASWVQLPPAPEGPELRVLVDLGGETYRAPEASAARAAAPAEDAYALGAILYELLAGAPPRRDAPAPSLCRPECPRAVDDLVEALLADAPGDRPALAVAAGRLTALLGAAPLIQA